MSRRWRCPAGRLACPLHLIPPWRRRRDSLTTQAAAATVAGVAVVQQQRHQHRRTTPPPSDSGWPAGRTTSSPGRGGASRPASRPRRRLPGVDRALVVDVMLRQVASRGQDQVQELEAIDRSGSSDGVVQRRPSGPMSMTSSRWAWAEPWSSSTRAESILAGIPQCPRPLAAPRQGLASPCDISPCPRCTAWVRSACRIRWHVDCESAGGSSRWPSRSLPASAGRSDRPGVSRAALPRMGRRAFGTQPPGPLFRASTSCLALRGVVRSPRPVPFASEVSMSTDRTDPTPPIDMTRRTLVQARRRRRRVRHAARPAHGGLRAGLRQAREGRGADRLHPADRLRVGRDGLGARLRQEVRRQDRADQGSLLGRRARQARQRRARHGARAVRPDLRRAPGHRRAEEGHGGADEPEPQRPGHHAVEEARRQGRASTARRSPS